MFRSFTGDENSSGGQSLPSQAVQGLASAGLGSQESSWINALARPPRSFLHKYVTRRPRTPALCDEWHSSMKTSFLCEENVFLRRMDDMISVPHTVSNLTQLQGVFNGASAANAWLFQGTEEPEAEFSQDWMTQRSLRRTFFSRVWSTSPEVNLVALRTWVPETRGGGPQWLSSFWGGSVVSAQGLLSDVSLVQDRNLTGSQSKTKAAAVFIQSRWILGESAGPNSYKGETFNAGALQPVQNMEGATASHHQRGSVPGSVALDQDNGYSSLEEELFQVSCLHLLTEPLLLPCGAEGPTVKSNQEQEDTTKDADLLIREENENMRLDETAKAKRDSLTLPKCQNKTIAFIMGCPCSDDDDDDDDNQSDGESSDGSDDDDDDDGFNSEGSSSLSVSTGDDESEVDTEYLWSSLCPSADPYNPQNFTAQLQTSTPSQTNNVPTPLQSKPTSFPCSSSLSASQPSSDSWDESAAESDADEAESLRLWTSFSSCLDPYSPLNFQATLRTRRPGQAGTGSRTREVSRPREVEPAEKLESGNKELKQSSRTIKKVSEHP